MNANYWFVNEKGCISFMQRGICQCGLQCGDEYE